MSNAHIPPLFTPSRETWINLQRRNVAHSILMLSGLAIVIQSFGAWSDHTHLSPQLAHTVISSRALHVLLAAIIAMVALRFRRHLGLGQLKALAIAVSAPVLPLMWIAQSAYLMSDFPFGTMGGFKLAPIIWAAVNWGSKYLGLAFVLTTAAEALGFWWFNDLGHHSEMVAGIESFNLACFFIASVGIWYLRLINTRVTRDLFETKLRNHYLAQMAKIFLFARDQANSPLQTLELGLGLLDEKIENKSTLQSALKRLRSLFHSFAKLESHLDFANGDPLDDEALHQWFR